MNDFVNAAHKLVKGVLSASGLKILEHESAVGDYMVNDRSGHCHQLNLRVANLNSSGNNVIIPKSDWNYELPENLWIALVLFMDGIEPHIYLIPSDVFHNPDNHIFFDNEQGERFKHLSNWEIKIFTEGIQKLSEYAFATSVKEFL